jgi:hypothetical protein
LVRYWHANFVGIEEPAFGATNAHLVIPIPGSASRVSWLGVIELREKAGSALKIVSLEAGKAVSSGVR